MSAPPRKVVHLPKVRMLSRGGRLPAGLRITNVKSIRAPQPETPPEDKLKAQVQKEIASRARTCAHAGYECWAPVLAGRRYCGAHILADAAAPYAACGHAAPGGERCERPAPRRDARDTRDPLCFEHARAALLARQRSTAPPPPVLSAETLLNRLQHYVKPERVRTTSCASSVSVVSEPADSEPAAAAPPDPFRELDVPGINSAHSLSILECGSDSSSDADSVTLGPGGSCRHRAHASDAEDAPAEDAPLWRAGVFTAEEAVSETKQALRALQAAYARQASRLRALLAAARRRYLAGLKRERELHCSISSQARSAPPSGRERRQLRKLKAYAGYHRRHGADALLARKLHHKRTKGGESGGARVPSGARCSFSEGGVRCAGAALPAARHCARHVLRDPHQVLFKACGDARGVAACGEPAPPPPLARACRYHTDPPPYCLFTLKKDDTDSDTDTETAVTDCSVTDSVEHTDRSLDPLHHTLARVPRALDRVDHSLDDVDHSLDGVDHSLDDVDQSLDPTDGSLDAIEPTIDVMEPTIDTLEAEDFS